MSNTKTFPNILESKFVMQNSDLCVVGVYLGYEHNQVVEEIQNDDCRAYDGEGTIVREREADPSDYSENEVIRAIFEAIFNNYPHVDEITICN